MPMRKIASFLRARKERKKNDADRQSEALAEFLDRLEAAFPDHTFPVGKKRADELALLARERNVTRSLSHKELSEHLKRAGVDASQFSRVAIEAAENPTAFARRWVGELTRSGQERLSDLKGQQLDVFPAILVGLRDLYASDPNNSLARDIFVRDVARVVVERVLTKLAKRA